MITESEWILPNDGGELIKGCHKAFHCRPREVMRAMSGKRDSDGHTQW